MDGVGSGLGSVHCACAPVRVPGVYPCDGGGRFLGPVRAWRLSGHCVAPQLVEETVNLRDEAADHRLPE